MLLGSPQEVIDKILFEHELFGMTRFLIQFSVGTLPHSVIMRSIELYGTKVAPAVRNAVSSRAVKSGGKALDGKALDGKALDGKALDADEAPI